MLTPFHQLSVLAGHVIQAIPFTGSFGTTNKALAEELIASGWVELSGQRLHLTSEGMRAYARISDVAHPPGRSLSKDGSADSPEPKQQRNTG